MEQFTVFDIFYLAAGLSLFLLGMHHGEKNIQRIGGTHLKKIIKIVTGDRFFGFALGFFLTLLTQSSSATTVILVGLATANLITLSQSVGTLLGANVATTVTVQLFAFKFYHLAPLFIALGYILSLAKKSNRISLWGRLILAIGFIFFGMYMMSQSVEPLQKLPLVHTVVSGSLNYPLLGLLVGTLLTAVIQSSAATIALCIALSQTYTLSTGVSPPLADIFPLILGANLGTCATAFLSTFNSNREGVRIAVAHVVIKIIGIALFLPFLDAVAGLLSHTSIPLAVQIANAHTAFNVVTAIVCIPLLTPLSRLVMKLVPHQPPAATGYTLHYIHPSFFTLPTVGLAQAREELVRMGRLIESMMDASMKTIETFDAPRYRKIIETDNEIDFLHESIIQFLTGLSQQELADEQSSRAYTLIMITTELEHIGDIISKNIPSLTDKLAGKSLSLSGEGQREIERLYTETISRFRKSIDALSENDLESAQGIFDEKQRFHESFQQYCDLHLDRLYRQNRTSLATTSIHMDILEEINRINHFTFRIAAHLCAIYRAD
jgi:phosphate:Na+ symporter